MKQFLASSTLVFITTLMLNGCAGNNPPAASANADLRSPSPLNTSANPWTNVNPQVQAQQQAGRVEAVSAARGGR